MKGQSPYPGTPDGTLPEAFHGKFFDVPSSYIEPKPFQKPHPPIYLAAYAPGSMQRVATMADGWMPAGIPLEPMGQMMEGIRGMARQAGRDPAELKLVVRANFNVTGQPLGDGRGIFYGSPDEIKSDIKATKALGADELCFDPTFSSDGGSLEGFLKTMEQMKKLAAEA